MEESGEAGKTFEVEIAPDLGNKVKEIQEKNPLQLKPKKKGVFRGKFGKGEDAVVVLQNTNPSPNRPK